MAAVAGRRLSDRLGRTACGARPWVQTTLARLHVRSAPFVLVMLPERAGLCSSAGPTNWLIDCVDPLCTQPALRLGRVGLLSFQTTGPSRARHTALRPFLPAVSEALSSPRFGAALVELADVFAAPAASRTSRARRCAA